MQPVTIKPGRFYCGALLPAGLVRCGDARPGWVTTDAAGRPRNHRHQCDACMRASQSLARRMRDALDDWDWHGRRSWESNLAFSLCLAALLGCAADRAVAALELPVGHAPSPPLTEGQLARLRGIGQRVSLYESRASAEIGQRVSLYETRVPPTLPDLRCMCDGCSSGGGMCAFSDEGW